MPTYEYVCKKCDDQFELWQSFSAKPLKTHDTCGGNVQKVFHARGVVFKGSGFYATDSRTSNSLSTSAPSPASTAPPTTPADSPSSDD